MTINGMFGLQQSGFSREVEQMLLRQDMREQGYWKVVPYKHDAIVQFMKPENRAALRYLHRFQGATESEFDKFHKRLVASLVETDAGLVVTTDDDLWLRQGRADPA